MQQTRSVMFRAVWLVASVVPACMLDSTPSPGPGVQALAADSFTPPTEALVPQCEPGDSACSATLDGSSAGAAAPVVGTIDISTPPEPMDGAPNTDGSAGPEAAPMPDNSAPVDSNGPKKPGRGGKNDDNDNDKPSSDGPPAMAAGSPMPMPSAEELTDADIEKCYELRAHGRAMTGDDSKYGVPGGENYTSFIFKAPWSKPVQALRFRHLADNRAVLHHWILYTEQAPAREGDIQPCDLDGFFGALCGQGTTRSMITGWAPGRPDFRLPPGVGLELPAPGSTLALEMHYFNTGSGPGSVADRSGVEVCVTSKFRAKTASITWLGTESIRIPGNSRATATGTCTPRRSGLRPSESIHVLYSWPHMHRMGRHLTSIVNRADGSHQTLYDGDFDFDRQTVHETPMVLSAGDSITTTCAYENGTPSMVKFGQSTTEEMCFNFVYAWPAHALDNPGSSFGEAQNTCLQ